MPFDWRQFFGQELKQGVKLLSPCRDSSFLFMREILIQTSEGLLIDNNFESLSLALFADSNSHDCIEEWVHL